MPEIKFESSWLQARNNVQNGDYIKFLDAGVQDQDGKWTFVVAVLDRSTHEITGQKKFGLNKTNFKAVSKMYGTNSDNWVNKEMRVTIIKAQNQKGELVDAVRLTAPGAVEQGLEPDNGYEYESQLD